MSSEFKEFRISLMAADSARKVDTAVSSDHQPNREPVENDLTKRACILGIDSTSSFQNVSVPLLKEQRTKSKAILSKGYNASLSGPVVSANDEEALVQSIHEPLCKMLKLDTAVSCHDKFRLDDPETSISHDQFIETCDEVVDTILRNVSLASSEQTSSTVNNVNAGEEPNSCGSCSGCDRNEDFYQNVEENLSFESHETEIFREEVPTTALPLHQKVCNSCDRDDNAPLYPSARITIGSTIVLVVLFTIKYNLAADAIGHLLSLLSLILPAGHILPTTLNNFKNYFRNIRNPLVFHYYCSFCLTYVSQNKDTETLCPNGGCLKDLTAKGALSYFIEIPIIHQLRTFFSRKGFYEEIQHRFSRGKNSDDAISDVYDGVLYKELCEKGILNSKDNISFIMNTDGVPVFKSSKVSIWPVFMIINELPYNKRMAKENMLLSGLWFGEKKPAMCTFLKPQSESLRELEKGIELEAPGRGKFTCKGVVLAWTCDLPARRLVCNSMQFNGQYGCWKCLQQGKTVKAAGGHVRIFPYQVNDPKGPLRNKEDAIRHATEVTQRQLAGEKCSNVMGVKGPSWLSLLEDYDNVRGIAIDYMHGVLLGVQKLLLKLWFNSSFSGKAYSISHLSETLDERLQNITPTLEISRLPRSITEHLKYWKANELRSFLLYYGIPSLYGLLPDAYFNHYVLFVHAIYLLLKDEIKQSHLCEAENLLNQFCALFPSLYEERFTTMNIHQLLHLSDDVRELGPLYTHSCFPFEDKNGFILKQIHGTQFIDSQITYAVTLTQKIPELRQSCILPGSEEEKLFCELSYPQKPKRGMEILPEIFILGTPFKRNLNDDEYKALECFLGYAPCSLEVTAFNRLELKSCYIYGTSYKRMFRRNCSTIKYEANGSIHFGQVRYFIQHHNAHRGGQVYHLAIVQPLNCHNYSPASHINVITVSQSHSIIGVVDIRSITQNCIYISFPDDSQRAYVCEFPNKKEME